MLLHKEKSNGTVENETLDHPFDIVLSHIAHFVQLTPEEQQVVSGYLQVRKIRKKQYLVAEGEHCRTEHFVIKGCFRSFYVDEK